MSMNGIQECLDQGSFIQVFGSAFCLGFIVAVTSYKYLPSLFYEKFEFLEGINITTEEECKQEVQQITEIGFENRSTINYVSCNHSVPDKFIDGEMIDEIFGFIDSSDPNEILDVFAPLSMPALARLVVLDCMFQSFPIEIDFYKVFSHINKGQNVVYIEGSKETLEVHFVDYFGKRRCKAFHPGDMVPLPISKEVHLPSEPVLTKAVANFYGMEVVFLMKEEEEGEIEEERTQQENETEEEQSQRMWQNFMSTPSHQYGENNNEEEEHKIEEEEEGEETASEIEDENEVCYEIDVFTVVDPWLRYKTDDRLNVLPFILRDIIASDKELFELTQSLSVWGTSINLEYSDGTIVSFCLDEKGYKESVCTKNTDKQED